MWIVQTLLAFCNQAIEALYLHACQDEIPVVCRQPGKISFIAGSKFRWEPEGPATLQSVQKVAGRFSILDVQAGPIQWGRSILASQIAFIPNKDAFQGM